MMLKKSKIKATNIRQTASPTQGTMNRIRAAHLLSILSSDANEADRLGRIEFFVVIGSVVQYGNSLIEAKIANQRAALGWC